MTARPLPKAISKYFGYAVPLFLTMSIILGGASRNAPAAHAILQVLAALALIAWLWTRRPSRLNGMGLVLLAIILGVIATGALQLFPLPPQLWGALPGRAPITEGFALLGADLSVLPLSLAPDASRDALLGFLPPVAAFLLAASVSRHDKIHRIAWWIAALAVLSTLLGFVQMFSGQKSPLYVYVEQNRGFPVGFFANVNHQASLCLMALPFIATTMATSRFKMAIGHSGQGGMMIASALAMLAILGVLAAGSFFGYVMLGPVIVASGVLALGGRLSRGGALAAMIALAVTTGLGWIAASSPMLQSLSAGAMGDQTGPLGRPAMALHTTQAAQAFFPFGSGVGTFEAVYPWFEAQDDVSTTYAPHAHNEYLQVAMEMGVFGLVALLAALVWWMVGAARAWAAKPSQDVRLQRAASLVLLIAAIHSFVDYPLRTAALSVLAAICAGILAGSRPAPKSDDARDPEDAAAAPTHVDI